MMLVRITVGLIVLAIDTNYFVNVDSTEPEIECNFCDRKFKNVAARNVHLKTHRPRIKFEGTNNVLLMRHSERDDWKGQNTGDYVVNDELRGFKNISGLPRIQRKRNDTLRKYRNADPPITVEGFEKSKLFGEAMRFAGVKIKRVYSSPAFRCIQTCHGILTGLGIVNELPIRIETGLYEETLGFEYDGMNFLLTDDELLSAGYNIDVTYQPQMLREDLGKLKVMIPSISDLSGEISNERFYTLLYTRNHNAVRRILEEDQEKDGKCILIVAHSQSVETCSRILVGLKPWNIKRPGWLDLPYPDPEVDFLGMVHLQKAKSNWTLNNSPIPVPTIHGRFIFEPFHISQLDKYSEVEGNLHKYGVG